MTAVTTPARRHFAVIALFASVVRAAMLWFTTDSLAADPDAYRRIACCLAETDVFGLLDSGPATKLTAQPTAFRPPLYPWLLSFLVSSDGTLANGPIAVLHWILGVSTSAGVFYLARSMKQPLSVATCAAMLVAIDPLLLQSSSQAMTETLATALSTAGLICWVRLVTTNDAQANIGSGSTTLTACLLGLTASLAYLCRPTFILWPLGITALLTVMAIRSQDALTRRLHIRSAAILLATLSVFIGSWTWRNWLQLGKPIWATTHGGYTLLLGNNPSYYQYLRSDAQSGKLGTLSTFWSGGIIVWKVIRGYRSFGKFRARHRLHPSWDSRSRSKRHRGMNCRTIAWRTRPRLRRFVASGELLLTLACTGSCDCTVPCRFARPTPLSPRLVNHGRFML